MVGRIKDDLVDTLDFRSKLKIAISDILILPVCFPKVKPKVKKKNRRNKVRFHCLFAFRWIPNTKTLNTQFKIWNTQLSQKEVGKYPIASNPYLELCYNLYIYLQVQESSPGHAAGLEAFFDFIVAIGTTRLVSCNILYHINDSILLCLCNQISLA